MCLTGLMSHEDYQIKSVPITTLHSMCSFLRVAGTSYGGCNDGPGIMSLHKEGKLVPLLKSVGAL